MVKEPKGVGEGDEAGVVRRVGRLGARRGRGGQGAQRGWSG